MDDLRFCEGSKKQHEWLKIPKSQKWKTMLSWPPWSCLRSFGHFGCVLELPQIVNSYKIGEFPFRNDFQLKSAKNCQKCKFLLCFDYKTLIRFFFSSKFLHFFHSTLLYFRKKQIPRKSEKKRNFFLFLFSITCHLYQFWSGNNYLCQFLRVSTIKN